MESANISYMGTDGMRGKVDLKTPENCLNALMEDHILTKEIIELSAYSFALMLIQAGKLSPGDSVCTGNDGRDAATGWALDRAMKAGFSKCGINVIDLGVIPTPYIPFFMLREGISGGAMLTASHNPSNQNGIKFFFEGKKILPEGLIGDIVLSSLMRNTVLEIKYKKETGKCVSLSYRKECLSFLTDNLPSSALQKLKGKKLFIDTANGAYTDLAQDFFEGMGISITCVNEKPDGLNINERCGVAEIEGSVVFERKKYSGTNRIIASLFEAGATGGNEAFGIVLDGDGDRGFVLYYEPSSDRIYVLDGDICGFLIASFLKNKKATAEGVVVLTVESDIMAAAVIHENLGIKPVSVDVGDKWICNYVAEPMLLGFESSGHIIIPTAVPCFNASGNGGRGNCDGSELRAGNGLYSALMALCAIMEYGSVSMPFYEPFSSGYSKTFYTYFIEKERFSRDSPIWKKDKELILEELAKWSLSRSLKDDIRYLQEEKKERDMLCFSVYVNGVPSASIFSRNSGTENKNAVYLKCRRDLSESLLPIVRKIRDIHRLGLKDRDKAENVSSERILGILKAQGFAALETLQEDVKCMEVKPLLYALSKEELIYSTQGENNECLWTLQRTE